MYNALKIKNYLSLSSFSISNKQISYFRINGGMMSNSQKASQEDPLKDFGGLTFL